MFCKITQTAKLLTASCLSLCLVFLNASSVVWASSLEGPTEHNPIIYVSMPSSASNDETGGEGTREEPYYQLTQAIDAARDGDTVIIRGRAFVNAISEYGSEPLVINKAITITSESEDNFAVIDNRRAGIVCTKDITLHNINFSMSNGSNPNIFANGNRLTLNNVIYDTSAFEPHIFVGGITNNTGNHLYAPLNSNGLVTIEGYSNLGNIYAGGLNEAYPYPVTIDTSNSESYGNDTSTRSVFSIGAYLGAYDASNFFDTSNKPEPPVPSGSLVSEELVQINTSNNRYNTIIGTANAQTNVEYADDTNYLNNGFTVKNITNLTVNSGNLNPTNESVITNSIILKKGVLNLNKMGNITIQSFTSESSLLTKPTLILGKDQTLNIQNNVSGITNLGIEEVFNNRINQAANLNHSYIIAPLSTEDNFNLLSFSNSTGMFDVKLQKSEDGAWQITNNEDTEETARILINRIISIDQTPVPSGVDVYDTARQMEIEFNDASDTVYIDGVVLQNISVNNIPLTHEVEDDYQVYKNQDNDLKLELVDNAISLTKIDGTVLDDGEYNIKFTIPEQYVTSNENINVSASLIIGEAQEGGGDTEEDEDEIVSRFLSDFEGSELIRSTVQYGTYTRNKNLSGNPISLKIDDVAITFKKGVLAHATADLIYDLGSNHRFDFFSTYAGIDTSQPRGNVNYIVQLSNDQRAWEEVFRKNDVKGTENAIKIEVPLNNYRYLRIYIDNNGGNGNDHAALGNPIVYSEGYNANGQDIIKDKSYYENIIKNNIDAIKDNIDNIDPELELTLLQYDLINKAKSISLIHFLTESDNAAENQVFMQEFFNNKKFLKDFSLGGSPVSGNYVKALENLALLYRTYQSDLSDNAPQYTNTEKKKSEIYEKMMISIALTSAKPIVNWIDGKNAGNVVDRYAAIKALYNGDAMFEGDTPHENGLFHNQVFESLEIEEMRWVVDNMVYDNEIAWLNYYASQHPRNNDPNNLTYPMIYSPHHHIKYLFGYNYANPIYRDQAQFSKWNEKYYIEKFGLPYKDGVNLIWHLFEEGSVCGGISKTGTNLAQSYGVPAAVIGQPGHAAFLVYSLDNEGNGVWNIDNDVSGWTGSEKGERMPLDWGNASDTWNSQYQVSYVTMAQAALNNYADYDKAEKLMMLASAAETAQEKLAIYKKAIEIMPYHMDAWRELINLYIAEHRPSVELANLAERLTTDMQRYPMPMYDLTGIILKELQKRISSDETAASQLARVNFLRTGSLTIGKATQNNVYPNSNVTRIIATSLLGNNKFTLATFSFDGDNAGKLIFNDNFSSVAFKYSIGNNILGQRKWSSFEHAYTNGTNVEYAFTDNELEQINEEDDIYILLEGLNDSEENYFKIDITKPSVPNNFYANDDEHKIMGLSQSTPYEYKLSSDDEWENLTSNTTFTPEATVDVRIKTHGTAMSSDSYEYEFGPAQEQDDTRSYISIDRIAYQSCSSEQGSQNQYARNALDANPKTTWHTNWGWDSDHDRNVVVKLDKPTYISGIDYLPSQGQGDNGIFLACNVQVSSDGQTWEDAGSATGWNRDKTLKTLSFEPKEALYVKVIATEGYNNFAAASMISLYEDKTVTVSTPPSDDTGNTGDAGGTGGNNNNQDTSGNNPDSNNGNDSPTGGSNNNTNTENNNTNTGIENNNNNSQNNHEENNSNTSQGTENTENPTNGDGSSADNNTNANTNTNGNTNTPSNDKETTSANNDNENNSTAKEDKSLLEQLETIAQGDTLYADVTTNVLSTEELNIIKEKGATVVITTPQKVKWTIDGTKLDTIKKDVNLYVDVNKLTKTNSSKKDTIIKLTNGENIIVADFLHDGALPGTITVEVPLSAKQMDYLGETIKTYHVDKKLESLNNKHCIVNANSITLIINKCSPYIFVGQKVADNTDAKQTEDRNNINEDSGVNNSQDSSTSVQNEASNTAPKTGDSKAIYMIALLLGVVIILGAKAKVK